MECVGAELSLWMWHARDGGETRDRHWPVRGVHRGTELVLDKLWAGGMQALADWAGSCREYYRLIRFERSAYKGGYFRVQL